MNTIEEVHEYIDLVVECYWEETPSMDVMCNATPLNITQDKDGLLNKEEKQIMNEFVEKRVQLNDYKMCDVARMRIFPDDDLKPVFLLLVPPKDNSSPHEQEVIFMD